MNDLERGWLAGIIEGEGSFAARRNGVLCISVQMTDEDVIRRVATLMGSSVYSCSSQRSHHKSSWKTQLHGDRAWALVDEIRSLLGERRANRLLEIERQRAEYRASRWWYNKLGLSEGDYRRIAERKSNGESAGELADEYGVGQMTIYNIARRVADHDAGKPLISYRKWQAPVAQVG